jgi:hypothetical protein
MAIRMKSFKIYDVIIVGMFALGLAFSLIHRITHQEIPTANTNAKVSPQQDHLNDTVS